MRSTEGRLRLATAVTAAYVFLASFGNEVLSHINLQTGWWAPAYLFPLLFPVGSDFREGLYYPAKILLQGRSPYLSYNSIYPPFTVLLAVPFRLFSVDTAYLIQVVLLYGLNIVAVWVAVRVAALALKGNQEDDSAVVGLTDFALIILVAFLVLTSYGFYFSVERGNDDIFALAAAVLGLWLLLKAPRRIWLQTLALSASVHLKLYPLILLPLLVWRHGRKSWVPLIVVNALMLLCTGPANALNYIKVIVNYTSRPFLWVGNHSAASFGALANGYLADRVGWQIPVAAFYAGPILIWLLAAAVLWRKGFSPLGAVFLFAISVPLMGVVPPTSHDYKLVILGAPVAMVLLILIADFGRSRRWIDIIQIAVVMTLMLVLTRSYAMLPTLLGNKYPFLLALELAFLWIMLRVMSARDTGPGIEGAKSAVLAEPA
jgi:hypothetical protein